MAYNTLRAVSCAAVVIVAAAFAPHATADITATGSFLPDPLDPDGDGVVTSEMQLGRDYPSTTEVTVTGGETLITQLGSIVGYSPGTVASVSITNSTWTAESAVFIAHTGSTKGTVEVTNGTWTVESNVAIAQGDNSIGEVILNSGSWTTESGVKIADGEDCTGTVTLNGGTWTARTGVTVGGRGFTDSNGTGTISIHSGAEMDSQYGLWVTSFGSVEIDGGTLALTGQNDLEGGLSATANGGTIRIGAGPGPAGDCLLNVGSDVNLANCDVEIGFLAGFTPDPADTFNLFDPVDEVDLEAALSAADPITTPTDWQLDHATGVMSNIFAPPTLTWDGDPLAEWMSPHWLPDSVVPAGNEAMVVNSGTAAVLSDLTDTPAYSLAIASEAFGGTVYIGVSGVLQVTGGVDVGLGGTLSVDGVLAADEIDVMGGSLTNNGVGLVGTARLTVSFGMVYATQPITITEKLTLGNVAISVVDALFSVKGDNLLYDPVRELTFQGGEVTIDSGDSIVYMPDTDIIVVDDTVLDLGAATSAFFDELIFGAGSVLTVASDGPVSLFFGSMSGAGTLDGTFSSLTITDLLSPGETARVVTIMADPSADAIADYVVMLGALGFAAEAENVAMACLDGYSYPVSSAVPEPATMALVGMGMAVLLKRKRRRMR